MVNFAPKYFWLILGLPLLIVSTAACLALSPLLIEVPQLALGITYDLTLTAPLVYYLLVRKQPVPKITVVPWVVLGVGLASWLLPAQHRYHLDGVKTFLLPLLELAVLLVVIRHIYRGLRVWRSQAAATRDVYLLLRESAGQALGYPRLAAVIASEMAMIYYALLAWKAPKRPENSFTGYRENGITALLGVILMMVLVETFLVHLLVARWSETAAWLLSAASVYGGLQLLGHLKALRHRHTEISGRQVRLKYGLFGDICLEAGQIARVELSAREIAGPGLKVVKLALLPDLESHNLVLYLKNVTRVEKAYGMVKTADVLLLHLDDRQAFADALKAAMAQRP